MHASSNTLIPIYTTRGDAGAFLVYPYLYNSQGEWIGWVGDNRTVYSIRGQPIGWMSEDRRILRKYAHDFDQPYAEPLEPPDSIRPPATVPLAPMMAELPQSVMDVLDEYPELLPTADFGELHEDMD